MSNKPIASNFLTTVALEGPAKGYELYVSPNFKHHNQYFKGDRQSLLSAMEEAHHSEPNIDFKIHQLIEEGDKVVTYSQVIKSEMQIAVFHMFRFENGKIVEMWDVGQMIELDCPNENGLF